MQHIPKFKKKGNRSFIIEDVSPSGAIKLSTLNGEPMANWISGCRWDGGNGNTHNTQTRCLSIAQQISNTPSHTESHTHAHYLSIFTPWTRLWTITTTHSHT
ncbi:hypothetical protein GOP47_0017062 [Adiantum capillus-veneris]|uniref:Uncharacterized protein n=1 Tax=Adiantum capillus-veneris TaxID=13818 RepID=A0A9D4UJ81_ADICA|nr:hypothetical protein GOP47_0017062 [Adiantum capillus-veneris]